MQNRTLTSVLLVLAMATGFLVSQWWSSEPKPAAKEVQDPLYWVAPMDANYRRDKPGKSPMGMDLVPVYGNKTYGALVGSVQLAPEIRQGLGVRTTEVVHRSLVQQYEATTTIEFNEAYITRVHPHVDGWIEAMGVVTKGDAVTKGQPLYTLYSPTLVNVQEELLVALERGQQALINSAKDRLRTLGVSESTIEAISASKKIERAVTHLAPMSGVVTDLTIRQGMYVQPGTQLMAIADPTSLWVIGEVTHDANVTDLSAAPITVNLAGRPLPQWQTKIDYVYPQVDAYRRTLRFRAPLTHTEGTLKPGMYAQATIKLPPSTPELAIPIEALIRTAGQDRVVMICSDGSFKSVEITRGNVIGDWVEIRKGLRHGDQVVTSAQFLIDSESSKDSDFQRMSHNDSASCQPASMSDHSMEGMDHSMEGMDHSMEGMDHSMEDMNHSMEGMDHSMEGMDHSMEGMDHSMEGMNHSQHAGEHDHD